MTINGLPCSSNSEGFIYLYVDRDIMLTPAPFLAYISYLLVCYLLPHPSYRLGTSYTCECLVTPHSVGLMDLWTSLGTVGGVVLRLYMNGVYPWDALWVWSLWFHFHLPPGEHCCFSSYFLQTYRLIIWPVIILFHFSIFTSANFCIVTNLLTNFTLPLWLGIDQIYD